MLVSLDYLTTWQQTLILDLRQIAAELVLAFTILLILLSSIFRGFATLPASSLALGGCLTALTILLAPQLQIWPEVYGGPAFSGLLLIDESAHYLRLLLILFALLLIVLTRFSHFPNTQEATEFYTLILGSTIGLMLMVSASHLAILFLALEMASLPSYVLSGFLRGKRSSEAALKYLLFGAASAGVALYGISLLVLFFGTGDLQLIAVQSARMVATGAGWPMPVMAGLLMVFVGLGFKLGVVPFHFWLPDVFSGATAEVGAYLSVASKIAAVGLIARVTLTLQSQLVAIDPVFLAKQLGWGMVIVAGLTMTLGNLAALAQTNFKRLLAYSTIAHAGYMLLALATFRTGAVNAVYFYLAAYLLMNTGAFAGVALLRFTTRSEELSACRGLIYRSPTFAICFTIFWLSLLGLPPLAGFVGKFQLFQSIFDAARQLNQVGQGGLALLYYLGLGLALLNTLISAGYYLKVLKLIGLDEPEPGAEPIRLSIGAHALLILLATGSVILGIWWEPLSQYLLLTSPIGG